MLNNPPRTAPGPVQPTRSPVSQPRGQPVISQPFITLPLSNTRPIVRGNTIVNQVRIVAPTESVDTSFWGPSLWFILHTLAEFSDRFNARTRWTDLIRGLQMTIPCSECSAHFNQWVASHPYVLKNTPQEIQTHTREWVLALHNDVNRRLGGDRREWNAAEVLVTYGGDRQIRLNEVEARIAEFSKHTTQGIILYLRNFVRLLRNGQ